jgi:hypothetical protein
MSVGPGGLMYQRPHNIPDTAGFYDLEHAISFSVHLLKASLYKKITGLLAPSPAMSEAEYSELDLYYFKTKDDLEAKLYVHRSEIDDMIRSICEVRDIKEASHPIGVVDLESTVPGASRALPYAEMLARARRLNCDAPFDNKPVVEWWHHSSVGENRQASGSTGVVNGTAALVTAACQSNGIVSGQDRPPTKHSRSSEGKLKCILM